MPSRLQVTAGTQHCDAVRVESRMLYISSKPGANNERAQADVEVGLARVVASLGDLPPASTPQGPSGRRRPDTESGGPGASQDPSTCSRIPLRFRIRLSSSSSAARRRAALLPSLPEIGRASCRERGEISV